MISVKSFVFNPFSENTYVVYDDTKEALVIDPGCYEPQEKQALDQFIKSNHLNVVLLLNTHCHIDHVLGNDYVKEKYNVPFLIHKKEESLLRAVKAYAPNYGFANYKEATPDKFIDERDEVTWGKSEFQVLFLPGHSPGHLGFYNPDQKILISGDVLFDGSIGRTDLPGGDMDTLIESIQQKLFILPDEVKVYSGHGGTTTLGVEKVSNPFCALDK
ncbi:MAG: MBL fold metallo-hydrolase [Cyclobacteriaceae bacterium]